MDARLGRRDLLKGLGGAGLLASGAFSPMMGAPPQAPSPWVRGFGALQPFSVSPDRIIAMNVCTRPFRAEGPRIALETLAGKPVVHNYGHGGSGWSLSWGSAAEALPSCPRCRRAHWLWWVAALSA